MPYNDLSLVRKINGVPVDLNYFNSLFENDAHLKAIADADEDLLFLDRDILPVANNQYSLGSIPASFSNGYILNLVSSKISLGAGTLAIPSLSIGTAGIASLGSNQLSIILNGLEPLNLTTSALTLKAANSTQLQISNSSAPNLLWALGSDLSGFKITSLTGAATEKAVFSDTETKLFNNLRLINGSALAPAYSFSSEPTTGLFKDSVASVLHFGVSGSKKLSLSGSALTLLADQMVLPAGSLSTPSLTFSSLSTTGISSVSGNLNLIFEGSATHLFNKDGILFVSENQSIIEEKLFSDNNPIQSIVRKALGSSVVPIPIPLQHEIYNQGFQGYDGVDFLTGAEFSVSSEEDYSNGTYGTSITISTVSVGENGLTDKLILGKIDRPSTHMPASFGIEKATHSIVGLGQQINVKEKSKIMIDTTAGNIEIKGFIEGREGQVIHLYKKVAANSFTILFNNATATQKVLLKGSTTYTNTNDYGGITLSFDDGIWREVSRS